VLDLSNNLIRRIGLLYRYMMRAIDIEMAALDIGAGRFSYLFMLYIREGLTQQEMACRLQADKAAVARTLAQMERQGFVARRPDASDRRITRVYLTDRSRALRGALEEAVQKVLTHLRGDLAAAEVQQLEAQLGAMLGRLDDHYQVGQKGGRPSA
jgi:DNA-binding MarR family transcriptional regulator